MNTTRPDRKLVKQMELLDKLIALRDHDDLQIDLMREWHRLNALVNG